VHAADPGDRRPWAEADAAALLAAFADPAIQRWHARTVESRAGSGAMIGSYNQAWRNETAALRSDRKTRAAAPAGGAALFPRQHPQPAAGPAPGPAGRRPVRPGRGRVPGPGPDPHAPAVDRAAVARTCVDKAQVSRAVAVLEDHGLIERSPGRADRRSPVFAATPDGRGAGRRDHAAATPAGGRAGRGAGGHRQAHRPGRPAPARTARAVRTGPPARRD
jgi:MarR family